MQAVLGWPWMVFRITECLCLVFLSHCILFVILVASCYCCLYLLLLFIFYFLYGYSCYFFAFCEHGHANFWFGILFSVLPCLLFFLLLFIVFFGFNGSVNKASPNGPYCGFSADANSIVAMGKVREVCMRKFTSFVAT